MSVKWTTEFTFPQIGARDKLGSGIDVEDKGQALILEPTGDETGGDGCLFVRIQSWDERVIREKIEGHTAFRNLTGQKVRVTIETIDD